MLQPIPDYKNLDLNGEALLAAIRMEARAREPASQEMFMQLVAPLLGPQLKTVLEFGCGTAALARRIASAAPKATVHASDKSEGMLKAAQRNIEIEGLSNIQLALWDVSDERSFPFTAPNYDLIISSVVIPYFDDDQTEGLVKRLAARLAPGGVLAFIEQDWHSDSVNTPKVELFRKVLSKDTREMKQSLALGLRPLLRSAGLEPLPRRSFLWSDDGYGPYTRDLLERFADSAYQRSEVTVEERNEWKHILEQQVIAGDFYYGIVYHLVAGVHA